jgi:molybdopterin molybdotransferase
MSDPLPPPESDVRMRGFSRRVSVAAALSWLDAQLFTLDDEAVSPAAAGGRVLARDMVSGYDVPGFERAMMDGFAVRSVDVATATATAPVTLRVIGEVYPGREFAGEVVAGGCVRIMTGAPLPLGADAVVPVERVSVASGGGGVGGGGGGVDGGVTVLLTEPIPAGKHVGRRGEDLQRGALVFEAGRRLRPQDLGVLSSIGIEHVPVVARPRVRLVVTGNELLPAGAPPTGVRIADANGPMLAALVARDGGLAVSNGVVPDDPEAIAEALRSDADVILVSGGSSVGGEDHAPLLLARDGELAVHGVAMRPASPTGMGTLDGRLVFLLPGNPVSCLCAYDFFAGRAIRVLGGRPAAWPYRHSQAVLAQPIASVEGRLDYARVRVGASGLEALGIAGASLLSSTTRADGFVLVPEECSGYSAGQTVDVWWYD